jgi:hypothetical protein
MVYGMMAWCGTRGVERGVCGLLLVLVLVFGVCDCSVAECYGAKRCVLWCDMVCVGVVCDM